MHAAKLENKSQETGPPTDKAPAQSAVSADQMRGDKGHKLTRRYDLRILPKLWEVLAISGDKIIGTGCIGTFDKDVVVGIARHLEPPGWDNKEAMVLDQLE